MGINSKKAKAARPANGPGAAPLHIQRIRLRGIRAIDWLDVRLDSHRDPKAGDWVVFLGDNGSGKTTILRAIALALCPPNIALRSAEDVDDAQSFFRRSDAPHDDFLFDHMVGAHVDLDTAPARSFMKWLGPSPNRGRGAPQAPELDVFGYGTRRADALGSLDRDVPLQPQRAVGTLFNKDARLIHAETWLRREKLRATAGGRFFDAVLTAVASLLPGGERVVLDGDQIMVVAPDGHQFPFAAMSDGHLSTMGWAIDWIARWAERYRDSGKLDENFAKDMPCVGLIDELDQHLHPKWQLDIIPRLRAAFPKTAFIVTTHNPLTLQGTRPGEVFVLQEDDATGQISIIQRDVPPGTDANRLLTGDWFGLGTTLDPETHALLVRHQEFLLAGRPENDPDRLALEDDLRGRLGRFADNFYEKIAQSVVAELLHDKVKACADITDADRARVKAAVKARLADLEGSAAPLSAPWP